MKISLRFIMIAFSVILNMIFLGSLVGYQSGIFSFNEKKDGGVKPLYLELSLTPDQSSAFSNERTSFFSFLQEKSRSFKTLQIELIGLIRNSPAGDPAVDEKKAEIQHLQNTIQDRVIFHIRKQSSILNPEQQALFFQLIRNRIEAGNPLSPPWMNPNGPCQRQGGPNEGN